MNEPGGEQRRRKPDLRSVAQRLRLSKPSAALALAALLGACGGTGDAAETRPTPSGLPVPRWVTLKFGTVNARQGPGDDHRKLWVYSVKGLPVQVVAETRDWRRVCDAEGGLAWVHKRTIDGARGVLNVTDAPLPLQGRAEPGAPAKAFLAAGALAKLDACKAGWCRVEAGPAKGWAPAAALWGADGHPTRCQAGVRR